MPTKQGDPLLDYKRIFNNFFLNEDRESVGTITYTFYDKKKMKKFSKKATKWLEKGAKNDKV